MNTILFFLATACTAAGLDVPKLDAALGMKGQSSGDEVKYSIPHPELDVRLDRWRIPPSMGVTSWVAFTPHEHGAMAMGDLVLLETEVKDVQAAAIKAGLSATALHNHFLRESPKVMYMHVGGMGEAEALAKAVRAALDVQRKLRAGYRPPKRTQEALPLELAIDTQAVSAKLGAPGSVQGSVFKIVLGRPDVPLKDGDARVSAFLGFNTWMAFEGTARRAAVAGDFAMREPEVEGVIRALVEHGLEIAAIHNHMVGEEPRIVFLHFWGDGPVDALVAGLKAGLERSPEKKP